MGKYTYLTDNIRAIKEYAALHNKEYRIDDINKVIVDNGTHISHITQPITERQIKNVLRNYKIR